MVWEFKSTCTIKITQSDLLWSRATESFISKQQYFKLFSDTLESMAEIAAMCSFLGLYWYSGNSIQNKRKVSIWCEIIMKEMEKPNHLNASLKSLFLPYLNGHIQCLLRLMWNLLSLSVWVAHWLQRERNCNPANTKAFSSAEGSCPKSQEQVTQQWWFM